MRRDGDGWSMKGEWRPEDPHRSVAVVACNSRQVVCAAGPHLYYIEIGDGELFEKKYNINFLLSAYRKVLFTYTCIILPNVLGTFVWTRKSRVSI